MKEEAARHPGLDLMRSAAILLVMWDHIRFVAEAAWPTQNFYLPPDGVDVFFVLSGFLVGDVWLRTVQASPSILPALRTFWLRRIWRIWPLYYIFLFLNIVGVAVGLQPGMLGRGVWTYVIFAQNLVKPVDLFFWESWSLCVEELFYFLMPLLFTAFSFLRFSPHTLLAFVALLLICLGWTYRGLLPQGLDYDLWYRKMAPGRLDAIGYGVMAAAFKGLFKGQMPGQNTVLWGVLGLAGAGGAWWSGMKAWPETWKWMAPGVTPAFLALTLPAFYSIKKLPSSMAFLTERVARWSYAAYLVHLSWVAWPIRAWMPGPATTAQTFIILGIYALITFTLSALLYINVERYFLRFRPSLKHH
jgi:peptidoglycan/LPS O-acetylase OafA/YrhL